MNSFNLTGHVTEAPKFYPGGVVTFCLSQGSGPKTQFFPVVCFQGSKIAFQIASELVPGSRVAVTGSLKSKNFRGRACFEVVTTYIEVLSRPEKKVEDGEADRRQALV